MSQFCAILMLSAVRHKLTSQAFLNAAVAISVIAVGSSTAVVDSATVTPAPVEIMINAEQTMLHSGFCLRSFGLVWCRILSGFGLY